MNGLPTHPSCNKLSPRARRAVTQAKKVRKYKSLGWRRPKSCLLEKAKQTLVASSRKLLNMRRYMRDFSRIVISGMWISANKLSSCESNIWATQDLIIGAVLMAIAGDSSWTKAILFFKRVSFCSSAGILGDRPLFTHSTIWCTSCSESNSFLLSNNLRNLLKFSCSKFHSMKRSTRGGGGGGRGRTRRRT